MLEYCKTHSVILPTWEVPVLRYTVEAPTAICARPGTHHLATPVHNWRMSDTHTNYYHSNISIVSISIDIFLGPGFPPAVECIKKNLSYYSHVKSL